MSRFTTEVLQGNNIDQCKELCNELMAFQMSQAVRDKELFAGMNFETRMKASHAAALHSHTVLAKEGDVPVGYIFSTVDRHTPESGRQFPAWAPKSGEGFLPDWVPLPQNIGCLSNLYLREAARGTGLATLLMRSTMDWFRNQDDMELIFVYISNGNDAAMKFYLKHGFQYSHEVFGGFISAAYMKK